MKETILIGNPNSGKTTLFNSLTKSCEHTGNWHGVTVDQKLKTYKYKGQDFKIIDLPGIYSLSPFSMEEKVSVDYVLNNKNYIVINIVDINNLYRNLYLTMELIEAGVPIILVINKTSKNAFINTKKLEHILGIKVVLVDAVNEKEVGGLKEIIYELSNTNETKNYKKMVKNDVKIEKIISKTEKLIGSNNKNTYVSNKLIAKKCLEKDESIIKKLKLNSDQENILCQYQSEISLDEIANNNYKKVQQIFEECNFNLVKDAYGKTKVDKVILNKYLCLPIFIATLLLVFYLTFFSVGSFFSGLLSNFIQNIFGNWLLNLVSSVTKNAIIYDFFQNAIIGGIGSVFSFLPQVVILFLCLGVLEDSGYLSRVAFSLDDIFSKIGLSGKSVYTLLMGFGCSTTACMTARTMESKNSQIKTAMLAPYMSCSAKLPIYTIIGSAFFGASNVFVIFGLYMLGVLVALILSIFYEKTFLKSGEQNFILEFPPYRFVKIRRLFNLVKDNIKQFLIRIGTLLISVNIIVWVLSSFSFSFRFVTGDGGMSMLETLGKIFAPIFAPLGFGSWGATSALIAGLIAKEIIVSSIAMFNGINSGEQHFENLSHSLTNPMSAVCFTPASAISYMVFCLLYSPCLASIAVLKKEIGLKWLLISILVQFILAYSVSLILYHLVNIILFKGILALFAYLITFILVCYSVYKLVSFFRKKSSCKNCNRCKH